MFGFVFVTVTLLISRRSLIHHYIAFQRPLQADFNYTANISPFKRIINHTDILCPISARTRKFNIICQKSREMLFFSVTVKRNRRTRVRPSTSVRWRSLVATRRKSRRRRQRSRPTRLSFVSFSRGFARPHHFYSLTDSIQFNSTQLSWRECLRTGR